MGLGSRIKRAWNAFNSQDKPQVRFDNIGPGNGVPYHKLQARAYHESSFANTIFNRIAIDSSMVDILDVKIDPGNQNQEPQTSGLQRCLAEEANIDQTGREFVHDLVYSMFDEGVVAVVPVETKGDPLISESYDIISMRIGKILQWYPRHVRVQLYNDQTGLYEELTLPKAMVAIIENPLYEVINAQNGTLARIVRKMAQMDQADEIASSGNLNLILQLPYVVKTDIKKKQAKERLDQLTEQLNSNNYGIGYVDGTEKITQLNRPVSNTLADEVKYLTEQFFNALGLTQNVFNGTASEVEMRAYYNRTIDPIVERVTAEFTRKFISKTARTQGRKLVAYRDPFKLVPVEQLATIADTFSRNAILSPNEIRKIVGYGPNNQPESDKLVNRNIAAVNQDTASPSTSMGAPK